MQLPSDSGLTGSAEIALDWQLLSVVSGRGCSQPYLEIVPGR